MTLRAGRVRFSFDYISIACLCLSVVAFGERYVTALACAAVHEAGHIFVLLKSGGELELALRCFGADIIDGKKSTRSYTQQAAAAIAGPLANLLLVLAVFPMWRIFPFPVLRECMLISAVMGAFNLLPVVSTDGGELAYIALLRFFGEKTARRVLFALTALLLIPLFSAAFVVLLRSRNNYTLLLAAMALAAEAVK